MAELRAWACGIGSLLVPGPGGAPPVAAAPGMRAGASRPEASAPFQGHALLRRCDAIVGRSSGLPRPESVGKQASADGSLSPLAGLRVGFRPRVRPRVRVRVRSGGRGTSDRAARAWPPPRPEWRAALRRLLRPLPGGPQWPREREWPQGSLLFSTTPRGGDGTRGRRLLLAERPSPAVGLRLPPTGGIGCQASGVGVLSAPPRVRGWSWGNGRPDVPVPREALQRAELRAWVGRSARLRDIGVGVPRSCGCLCGGMWVSPARSVPHMLERPLFPLAGAQSLTL